jgi:L-amino acid N-acyltransferase YncA
MADRQVRIRGVSDDDLVAVSGIFAHYVVNSIATFEQDPPELAEWSQKSERLAALRLPFLVAETDGAVMGYAYAMPWRPTPAYRYTVEDSVYIAPGWTRRGAGRLLLDALVTQCAFSGMRQMLAVVADTGDPASATLHRACGFTDAGRLRAVGYKHGRWIDTLLLQRHLSPPRNVG